MKITNNKDSTAFLIESKNRDFVTLNGNCIRLQAVKNLLKRKIKNTICWFSFFYVKLNAFLIHFPKQRLSNLKTALNNY